MLITCSFFLFFSLFATLFWFLIAPEIQLFSNCSILSDMFSLGLVMCSIFNQGHALIQANNSASTYLKQLEAVSNIIACWTDASMWILRYRFSAFEMNLIIGILYLQTISSCLIPFKRCFLEFPYHCKKLCLDWL